MMASERLGLYLVASNGERTPICDVHSYGAILDRDWHEVFYTGPGQKSGGIKQRTAGEVAAYEHAHEVALENEISMGGYARFLHSRKRNSYDIWLFGPLRFLDHAYGSLIVELSGYESRKIFTKVDKTTQKLTYWTEFPKAAAGHFHRCKLLQAGLHLPGGRNNNVDLDDLTRARITARPAIVQKPFVRAEWKFEATVAAQTDCALYDQEGI
jgi:hypothetical protein